MQKITNKAIALSFIVVCLLFSGFRAQTAPAPVALTPSNEDRVALYQALLDLTSPWTVMCIAAHPDDEDGTSLTVMRHKYGAHTVSVFTTFGEGGQNAIGPELYEELGAIRVRETMAAAEIQGSEPHFLGLKDFGYSKSADEAFKVWGHDEALRRMVLEIRRLHPDVIITNHSVANHDHGHHQATARLEIEAFDAAADPKRFPEQLKDGLDPWQVQRLFVRAGFGGSGANANQQPDQQGLVTIDPNEQDPVRGTTYAEQALAALQKHATQGPWPRTVADLARFRNSPDGRLPVIRYRLTREAKAVGALPVDSHKFYDGLTLAEKFTKEFDMPTIEGRPLVEFVADRSRVSQELLKHIRKPFHLTDDWSTYQRLSFMKGRIEKAFAVSAGLVLQVTIPNTVVTPNASLPLKIKVSNAGPHGLLLSGCTAEIPSLKPKTPPAAGPTSIFTAYPDTLKGGATFERNIGVLVPQQAPINFPVSSHLYEPSGLGLEVVTSCSLAADPGISGGFKLEEITRVDVSPEVEIADINPSPFIVRPPQTGFSSAGVDIFPPPPPKFSVQLVNHLDKAFKGELVFGQNDRKGETDRTVELLPRQSMTLAISIPSAIEKTTAAHTRPPAAAPAVWFSVRRAGSKKDITSERVPIVWANAHVARRLHVGYLRGFDFSLPNALSALGVESKELSLEEVKTADLQKYTTIIIDNRVYESQPELIAANQRLLDYAKDGGTLVVFYHKSNEWNPDQRRNRPQLAPYPLTLNDARITDENAPVTFIEPDHPLLNSPNKIGQEDFVGWIQERGLYYPKEWDSHYHALFSANDPGEKPLTGGLLVADYGRGHYIYTSMVWYRQLRAGVPGGYRMFANMISYGHQ